MGLMIALILAFASLTSAATTKLTWHGHAAFEVVTPSGQVLFIDPWLSNPQNPVKDMAASVKRADYLLVTHGHNDHVGDAVTLATRLRSKLVASADLSRAMITHLKFPKELATDLGNPGGELQIAAGEVTVQFISAVHSSSIDGNYAGLATGFLLKIKDGPTLYHSGDTAFFRDMEQLASADVDAALLNIGGRYGMEAEGAAQAARAVNPKFVVPHHFKTFPQLAQDPSAFLKELEGDKIAVREMKPGETLTFEGHDLKP